MAMGLWGTGERWADNCSKLAWTLDSQEATSLPARVEGAHCTFN